MIDNNFILLYEVCDIVGESRRRNQQPDHPAVADRDINHYARGSGPGHVAARASAADRLHVPRPGHATWYSTAAWASHDNPDVIISNGPVVHV